MTYSAGNPIQASDYNTFATAAAGMNQLYADLYPGASTLPNASFGYGQTPALTSVSVGNDVTAAQWTALFQTMRKSGTHQGTVVVPPLPASDPVIGGTIVAYNTPSTVASTIALLNTNKFNLAPGQSAQTSVGSSGSTTPWINSLTYTFSVNLGTWDQARYFFNAGGYIGIYGSYAGSGAPVSHDDYQWYNFLNTVGTIRVLATSTTSLLPNESPVNKGLWFPATSAPLTTTYQEVFYRVYGAGGHYTNSYIRVEARLAAAAPAVGSGTLQFRVSLVQLDTSPPLDTKIYPTTFTMSETHSAGAIIWPGTATITPGTFILA